LANTTVAIFKVNVQSGKFWKPYIGQAISGESDLMVLIGGEEEWATIQGERSIWEHFLFNLFIQ
jgi:hypothetical protein